MQKKNLVRVASRQEQRTPKTGSRKCQENSVKIHPLPPHSMCQDSKAPDVTGQSSPSLQTWLKATDRSAARRIMAVPAKVLRGAAWNSAAVAMVTVASPNMVSAGASGASVLTGVLAGFGCGRMVCTSIFGEKGLQRLDRSAISP